MQFDTRRPVHPGEAHLGGLGLAVVRPLQHELHLLPPARAHVPKGVPRNHHQLHGGVRGDGAAVLRAAPGKVQRTVGRVARPRLHLRKARALCKRLAGVVMYLSVYPA
eukprot:1194633-Prorocentrum_minimum.AAC.16